MNNNILGERLKEKRLRMGLRQVVVAEEIGCAPTSLTNYEKGRTDPPFEVLERLCKALEVHALDLLEKKYKFEDILEVLKKPVSERSYEEQVALNFSYDILKRQLPAEQKRLKAECQNWQYVGDQTGLSPTAIETLISSKKQNFEDTGKVSLLGMTALNKLLSCQSGITALNSVALCLQKLDGDAEITEDNLVLSFLIFASTAIYRKSHSSDSDGQSSDLLSEAIADILELSKNPSNKIYKLRRGNDADTIHNRDRSADLGCHLSRAKI